MSPVAVLVGAPGAGKSTVGRALAQTLGIEFLDTDDLVETTSGKTVSDIFISDGEPVFRAMEIQAVAEAISSHDGILALGGGAVLDAGSRELLRSQRVVWLRVSPEIAMKRVGMSVARPVLLGNVRGKVVAQMKDREPIYQELAQTTVDVDDAEIADIAAKIARGLAAGTDSSDEKTS